MQQPNVVFILIDDMGYKDLSCYGSSFYETPSIDRLATEGMRFTDAYAAAPVCSPTRASILSGQYPARLGVTNFIDTSGRHHPSRGALIDVPYVDHLPPEVDNLPRRLKQAGYATWHVGKWHLGGEPYYPDRQGFDVNVAGCHMGMPNHGYFSPWHIPTLKDGPAGQYLTDRVTDEAISLIESREQGRPFFLNMCYYSVHVPIEAPEHLVHKYRDKARALGLDERQAMVDGPFHPVEHKKDQRIRRRVIQSDPVYAAMVESLDTNIGRLLGALDREGLAENTIVIFTSDNGGLATSEGSPTCNLPLAEGKGWTYEGGVREPLLLRYPGSVRAGSVNETVVNSPDFFPTIMELAGAPLQPAEWLDGRSFAGALGGSGATHAAEERSTFWHYPHYGNQGGTPGSAVRKGSWKLIEFFEDGHLELYDLAHDIGEQFNLADREPDMRDHLHQELIALRRSVAALIPERNPGYERWEDRALPGHRDLGPPLEAGIEFE